MGKMRCQICDRLGVASLRDDLDNRDMKCPRCQSTHIRKNGHRRGKQNYQCKDCDRQFIESYSTKGYSSEVKENWRENVCKWFGIPSK